LLKLSLTLLWGSAVNIAYEIFNLSVYLGSAPAANLDRAASPLSNAPRQAAAAIIELAAGRSPRLSLFPPQCISAGLSLTLPHSFKRAFHPATTLSRETTFSAAAKLNGEPPPLLGSIDSLAALRLCERGGITRRDSPNLIRPQGIEPCLPCPRTVCFAGCALRFVAPEYR
jgi:hypothetical protein